MLSTFWLRSSDRLLKMVSVRCGGSTWVGRVCQSRVSSGGGCSVCKDTNAAGREMIDEVDNSKIL